MKVRRVYLKGYDDPLVAVWHRNQWIPLKSIFDAAPVMFAAAEQRMADDLMAVLGADNSRRNALLLSIDQVLNDHPEIGWEIETRSVLPLQPLSYRDFMLFEQHVIQAGRGFARRFMPRAYRMATAYERFSGKTFPKFKPTALWYEKPIYYMGNHLSFVPDGHPIAFPSYSRALDYELEIGAVIARPLKNADPESALDAIGGFVVFNDFSARDVQLPEMRSGFGPVKAKNFVNSISNVVVTADEILPHLLELQGEVRINGTLIARTSSKNMHHHLGKAIAYASLEEQLFPGELIATGTLPGGCALENDHWLKPGDSLTLCVDRIGTLTHPIVAPADQKKEA